MSASVATKSLAPKSKALVILWLPGQVNILLLVPSLEKVCSTANPSPNPVLFRCDLYRLMSGLKTSAKTRLDSHQHISRRQQTRIRELFLSLLFVALLLPCSLPLLYTPGLLADIIVLVYHSTKPTDRDSPITATRTTVIGIPPYGIVESGWTTKFRY